MLKKQITISFIFLFVTIVTAQENIKQQILDAINDGSAYAANVLLDENGKSRCDYQMIEGKWYDYEPPWHTGQIIYALVEAYKITKNEAWLDAAKKAGNWWVSLEIKDQPKLNGMVRAVHGDRISTIVFATVTDGTAGLFRLYDVTGDKRYADVPTRAGDWMMRHMYEPEHRVFYDNVDPKTGKVLKENSPFWPEKEHQKLFDVARPNNEGSMFKDMYEYTGKEKYKKMFLELCESLLYYQDEYGLWMDFMPNNKKDGYFHPRFNLWYAESLLEGYDLTGDKRYLEAAKKTATFYTKFQRKDGTFFYKNYVSGKKNRDSICGSTVSFAGIIWLRLYRYGVGDEFMPNIKKSLHWILVNRYAKDHPDPNLAGGFFESRVRFIHQKVWLVNRDIATSFGVRFLADYYHWLEK